MADPSSAVSAVSAQIDPIAYAKWLAPILAALVGYWLRGFEIRDSDLKSTVVEISTDIQKIIDAGILYWRRDTINAPKDYEDIALESEIVGRMHVLNSKFESIQSRFQENHTNLIRALMVNFRQCLTSGDFASPKGHSSSGQAIANSFVIASDLLVHLRSALGKRRIRWRGPS